MSKNVLITGAATGIGNETVKLLAKEFDHVIATDINPEVETIFSETNIEGIIMDVTEAKNVQQVFERVSDQYGSLEGLVNNAGIFLMGPVTEIDASELERILQVNVIGAYRVTQTFLPLLLKTRGRVVNIGSESSKIVGLFGHYALSKLTLNGYNEALRHELNILGLKSILIEPGAHETPLLKYSQKRIRIEGSRFDKELEKLNQITLKKAKRAKPAKNVAKVISKALTSRNPKNVYRVNNDYELKLAALLPRSLKDWLVSKIMS